MLENRQALLFKIEATYGVDAAPVAADDTILVKDVEFNLLGDQLARDHIKSYMGIDAPLNVEMGATISFTTEIKGNGSDEDVAPEDGVVYECCNFTESIQAAVSVTYSLNSLFYADESSDSATIWYYKDKMLHKIVGARGNMDSFTCSVGGFGEIRWTFTGKAVTVLAGTTPDITGFYATHNPPRFVSAAVTVDGVAVATTSVVIALNNEVVARESANAANGIVEYGIVDRAPTITLDPETPEFATQDYWSMFTAGATVAISFQVGTAALNTVTIAIPAGLIGIPTYGDRNKIMTSNLTFSLHPSLGDDELEFVYT